MRQTQRYWNLTVVVAFLVWALGSSSPLPSSGRLPDLSYVAETGNYTCDELIRWLGTEKHYSNEKKQVIFGLVKEADCTKKPSLYAEAVKFGAAQGKRSFFVDDISKLRAGRLSSASSDATVGSGKRKGRGKSQSSDASVVAAALKEKKCSQQDDFVVAYLSNYSINNNFSHFLHGLLRLFCALLDARVLVWQEQPVQRFVQTRNYTIWLDEYFKLSPEKEQWLRSFGGQLRSLKSFPPPGDCVSSNTLLYGSGCVRLLPPEKWFGYPGCRAGSILTAFGTYMRQRHLAVTADSLRFIDNLETPLTQRSSNIHSNTNDLAGSGLRIAFAVRDISTTKTGLRHISNLAQVQTLLTHTQHITSSMENVTFEHLDIPSTIRYMAATHIFVSVHGAGMTNMFFMNPGAAVVEIIPYPLCQCKSPDYFYGIGGYYHGSAVAQGLKHYTYCVPASEVTWHKIPNDLANDQKPGKCSWKHLHAVESVHVDPAKFVSLMRKVERDLVVSGTVVLTKPIININPHVNG